MPLPDSCVISEPAIQPTLCSRPRSNFLRGFFINLHLSSLPPFLPFLFWSSKVTAVSCWLEHLSLTLPFWKSTATSLLPPMLLLYPTPPRLISVPSVTVPAARLWNFLFSASFFLLFFCLLLAPLGLGTKWKQFQDIKLAFWFCLVIHSFWKLLINPLLNAEYVFVTYPFGKSTLCKVPGNNYKIEM